MREPGQLQQSGALGGSDINSELFTEHLLCVPGARTQQGSGATETTTNKQIENSGEGERSGSKMHQARVGDPGAPWPRDRKSVLRRRRVT